MGHIRKTEILEMQEEFGPEATVHQRGAAYDVLLQRGGPGLRTGNKCGESHTSSTYACVRLWRKEAVNPPVYTKQCPPV